MVLRTSFLTAPSVVALAKQIPAGDLLALLNRKSVKVSYLRENFGVISAGTPRTHDFGAFIFHGVQHGKRKAISYQEEIEVTLERALGTSAETTKLANAIADRATLTRYKGVPGKDKIIPDLARADVQDPNFLQHAIAIALQNLVPGYKLPDGWWFRLFDTGSGYAVDTSLDYNAINLVYHQSVPPEHSSIDAGYLLSHILDARAETFFSAYYMAELVTAPVKSDIIRLKHFDLFRRREANANEIEQFNELVLPEFPSLREIVNSGERSFSDFLKLLDEAERFKNFIQIANPDSSLVRHYQLEATKDTWAEHLPTKSVRFLVASGLGLLADAIAPTGVGTAIGLGVGAADSFLLV